VKKLGRRYQTGKLHGCFEILPADVPVCGRRAPDEGGKGLKKASRMERRINYGVALGFAVLVYVVLISLTASALAVLCHVIIRLLK